jgi:hypothetical protein
VELQQLTYLNLECSLEATAPAAAYSALTASSKLKHLNVNRCMLPTGVWQHVFPAGRQLPHLQELDVGYCTVHTSEDLAAAAAPEGSRLVSCCPALRSLQMQQLQYSAELLAPLTGLSGLHELYMRPANESPEGLEVVYQLTGLRLLQMRDFSDL